MSQVIDDDITTSKKDNSMIRTGRIWRTHNNAAGFC